MKANDARGRPVCRPVDASAAAVGRRLALVVDCRVFDEDLAALVDDAVIHDHGRDDRDRLGASACREARGALVD